MFATSSAVGVCTTGARSPGRRHRVLAQHHRARHPHGGELAVALHERDHAPLAGLVELHLGDVDGLCRVGIAGGVLGGERRLGLEALDPGRERALRLAVGPVGGVDRDLGVGELLAVDGEDAEAEPVASLGEDLTGRRDDEIVARRGVGDDLLERAAVDGRERRGLGRRAARVVAAVVVAAAAGGEEGERARGERERRQACGADCWYAHRRQASESG